MCKYCELEDCNEWLFDKDVDFGMLGIASFSAFIIEGNELHIAVINEAADRSIDWKIKINYCPICGRKLGSE